MELHISWEIEPDSTEKEKAEVSIKGAFLDFKIINSPAPSDFYLKLFGDIARDSVKGEGKNNEGISSFKVIYYLENGNSRVEFENIDPHKIDDLIVTPD